MSNEIQNSLTVQASPQEDQEPSYLISTPKHCGRLHCLKLTNLCDLGKNKQFSLVSVVVCLFVILCL